MNEPLNINSDWTRQIKSGEQPSSADLQAYLTAIHDIMRDSQKYARGTAEILTAKIVMTCWWMSLTKKIILTFSILLAEAVYCWIDAINASAPKWRFLASI